MKKISLLVLAFLVGLNDAIIPTIVNPLSRANLQIQQKEHSALIASLKSQFEQQNAIVQSQKDKQDAIINNLIAEQEKLKSSNDVLTAEKDRFNAIIDSLKSQQEKQNVINVNQLAIISTLQAERDQKNAIIANLQSQQEQQTVINANQTVFNSNLQIETGQERFMIATLQIQQEKQNGIIASLKTVQDEKNTIIDSLQSQQEKQNLIFANQSNSIASLQNERDQEKATIKTLQIQQEKEFAPLIANLKYEQSQKNAVIDNLQSKITALMQTVGGGTSSPANQVSFHTQGTSIGDFASIDQVVPYEKLLTNIGGGMNNPQSGIFTAPIAGLYYFAWSGMAGQGPTGVTLKLNGNINLVSSWAERDQGNMNIHALVQLKKDDQVSAVLKRGVIYDDEAQYTSFIGILLGSDDQSMKV